MVVSRGHVTCDSPLHSVARGGTRRYARASGITSIVSLHGHSATLKSTTSGSSLEPASGQVGYREIAKTFIALCFVESDSS